MYGPSGMHLPGAYLPRHCYLGAPALGGGGQKEGREGQEEVGPCTPVPGFIHGGLAQGSRVPSRGNPHSVLGMRAREPVSHAVRALSRSPPFTWNISR